MTFPHNVEHIDQIPQERKELLKVATILAGPAVEDIVVNYYEQWRETLDTMAKNDPRLEKLLGTLLITSVLHGVAETKQGHLTY